MQLLPKCLAFFLSLIRDLIHVGKQYSSLGGWGGFKAHLPIYLPRALCLFVEPNFLYLSEWIAHDRWWPTTFGSWSILGLGHIRFLPEANSWAAPF